MKPKITVFCRIGLMFAIVLSPACNVSQPALETPTIEEPIQKPIGILPSKAANAETAIAESGDTSWTLAVVGDSLVAEESSSLPERYAAGMAEDLGVEIEINNLGAPGTTCQNFLPNLQKYSFNRDALAEADIILIALGGGDLSLAGVNFFNKDCNGKGGDGCLGEALAEFRTCWNAFLEELTTLANLGDKLIRLIITGAFFQAYESQAEKYGPYLEFQDAFYAYQIESSESYGLAILDLYYFEEPEGFRMGDHVHVTGEGKALIADMLRELGYDY